MPNREDVDRIFAEAYQTLARTAELCVEHRNIEYEDDVLVRRSREMQARAAPKPKAHQPTADEIKRLRSQDWAAFVDGRIERALMPLRDAIGQCIGEERKLRDAEIVKLKSEFDLRISALRAEVEKQRRIIDDTDGSIVELPKFIRRTHAR